MNRFAPTENIRGQRSYLGDNFEGADKEGVLILRGYVHDPTAFRMDGVAGHAGLFSTADDLARYCQMILDGGIARGGNPTGRKGVLSSPEIQNSKNTLPPGRVSASRERISRYESGRRILSGRS